MYQEKFIGWYLPPLLQVTSGGSSYICHASFFMKTFLEDEKSVKKTYHVNLYLNLK